MDEDDNRLMRLLDKKAQIIANDRDGQGYIALVNGDKRRRPISWIDEAALRQYLARGIVEKKGAAYIFTASYIKRMTAP